MSDTPKLFYKPVSSSNLAAVAYDPETKIMGIIFKDDSEYHYADVSPEKHHAMITAPSVGSHFHKHIKDNHKTTKIN